MYFLIEHGDIPASYVSLPEGSVQVWWFVGSRWALLRTAWRHIFLRHIFLGDRRVMWTRIFGGVLKYPAWNQIAPKNTRTLLEDLRFCFFCSTPSNNSHGKPQNLFPWSHADFTDVFFLQFQGGKFSGFMVSFQGCLLLPWIMEHCAPWM